MRENNIRKIIPCLDLKDGKVVKGKNFVGLREMGDPVELAKVYAQAGADEIAILDISKTRTGHDFSLGLIREISDSMELDLTVGGGISSLKDIERLLGVGAAKVSIASAAVKNPDLIAQASSEYGSEILIIALDIKIDQKSGNYYLYTHGGTQKTDYEVFNSLEKYTELGAGEFLITGIDFDGAKQGFDLDFYKKASLHTDRPIIASGGAGSIEDFIDLFKETTVQAGLAASIFHQKEIEISVLKTALQAAGIPVLLQ